jgi:hypothetical protein
MSREWEECTGVQRVGGVKKPKEWEERRSHESGKSIEAKRAGKVWESRDW